jgi:Ca2+-binding RTX toxin-like protein
MMGPAAHCPRPAPLRCWDYVMKRVRFAAAAVVCAFAASLTGAAEGVPPNVIYGTNGHDVITATAAADVIYAKSGNDVINGVGDGDVVFASSGNDKVFLPAGVTAHEIHIDLNVGHDSLRSEGLVEDSFVNGGSGNDVIVMSGCGNDVRGESGNDKYSNGRTCSTRLNTASLGNGHDEVFLRNASDVHLGNGNDRLKSVSPGTVAASSGNDRVEIELGGNADVNLGVGHDFLDIEAAGNVTAYGSNGRDVIEIGRAGNNTINAGDGDDRFVLSSAANNDLDGGPGRADKLVIDGDSTGTTCTRIERFVNFAGSASTCH